MEFLQFTLPNGIRVVHRPTQNGQVAHCGLMIHSGTRDELDQEHGVAHFIEHSLFKGTQRRKAFHVLSRLDSVGAELNAFTTKEMTAIHASFIKEHFERAVELIADIGFNSTFPEKEIKKEKDVIIDEIQSYEDSPAESISDDFEDLIFQGHPLGRSILGTQESVRSLEREDILSYIERNYLTDRMVFTVVGDIPEKKIRKLADKYLAQQEEKLGTPRQESLSRYKPEHRTLELETAQAHLTLGNRAYPATHKNKAALILLANYLGGPAMNSRLSMNIREKHGIAYNIEANYSSYSDTGVFEIYLGTEKKMIEKSRKLIDRELKTLKEKKLSATQLQKAKQQLKGQIALAQESGASLMLAMGKSLLQYNRIDTTQQVFDRIDAISSEQLLEIANEVLDNKQLSSLTYI